MIRPLVLAGAGAIALLAAFPALAQSAPSDPAAFDDILRDAEKATTAPSADLDTGIVAPSITFEAETGKSDVSITLGDRRPFSRGFERFAFQVTTPIRKGEDEGVFFTDDDLSADTTLSFDYTVIATTAGEPAASSEERIALVQRFRAECLSPLAHIPVDSTEADILANSAAKAACNRLGYRDIRANLSDEQRERFDDPFLTAPFVLAGVNATVGYDGVEYRQIADPATKVDDDRIPWSVSVKAGVWSPSSSFYLGGGLEYAQTFKDQKSRTLCTTPVGGLQECFTGAYGEPAAQEEATVYGVARTEHAFDLPWFDRRVPLAFELKPAYAFDSEVAGVAASLYFVPNDKGALTGGIRLRVQTDDNDDATHDENVSVGLFVGVPFSLLD